MTNCLPFPTDSESLRHFHRFLAAADRVALELLVREGVLADPRNDHEFYYSALTTLAAEFCETYEETNVDAVVAYEQLEAMLRAAHMVGLAMGLRLRHADLGVASVTKGGA